MNKKFLRKFKKRKYNKKIFFDRYIELKNKIKKIKNLNIEVYSEHIKMKFSDEEVVINLEKKYFKNGILDLREFNSDKLVIHIKFLNKKSVINTIILPNLLKSIYIVDSEKYLNKIISNNTKIKNFRFFAGSGEENKFPKIKNKITVFRSLTIKYNSFNSKKNNKIKNFSIDLKKFLFGKNIELDIETGKLLGLKKLKELSYNYFALSGLKNKKSNISEYISNLKVKNDFIINNTELDFLKLEKYKYTNVEINNSTIKKLIIKNADYIGIVNSSINNFCTKNIKNLLAENTIFKNKIILKNCKKLKVNIENIYPDNKHTIFDVNSVFIYFDITKNNLKNLKKMLEKYLNIKNKTIILKSFIIILDENSNDILLSKKTIENTVKILKYLYLNLNKKIELENEISIHNFTWNSLNNGEKNESEILLQNLSRLVYRYIPIHNHLAKKGIKNTRRILDFIETNIKNNEIHPEILKCLYKEKILKKNLLYNIISV